MRSSRSASLPASPCSNRWYGKAGQSRTSDQDDHRFSLLDRRHAVPVHGSEHDGRRAKGPCLAWPVAFHVLNSIGFAHLLPVSLALFARLAPSALHGTVIGLYYLAFFAANTMVGWVGGWFEEMPTTDFWLMHAGFAAVSGGVFVLFKLLLARRLMGDAPEGPATAARPRSSVAPARTARHSPPARRSHATSSRKPGTAPPPPGECSSLPCREGSARQGRRVRKVRADPRVQVLA